MTRIFSAGCSLFTASSVVCCILAMVVWGGVSLGAEPLDEGDCPNINSVTSCSAACGNPEIVWCFNYYDQTQNIDYCNCEVLLW